MALPIFSRMYDKRIKKVENNNVFKIIIHADLIVEDAALESILAKEMFHHDGDIEGASTKYLEQFADPKPTNRNEKLVKDYSIKIIARTVYFNDSIGIICLSYNRAGKENITDVSNQKHLTYDLKAGKIVKLSDIVIPSLCDYLRGQGVDAEIVTDIKIGYYNYVAKTDNNVLNLQPYRLHKNMTDYGLQLIGINRENIVQQVAERTIFSDKVENEPSFPGGIEELMRFLSANIKYPKVAEEEGIQGRVFISFVVDSSGVIRDATLTSNSSDPSLDSEALRVVRLMPKWKPGSINGSPVSVKHILPVNFFLK